MPIYRLSLLSDDLQTVILDAAAAVTPEDKERHFKACRARYGPMPDPTPENPDNFRDMTDQELWAFFANELIGEEIQKISFLEQAAIIRQAQAETPPVVFTPLAAPETPPEGE